MEQYERRDNPDRESAGHMIDEQAYQEEGLDEPLLAHAQRPSGEERQRGFNRFEKANFAILLLALLCFVTLIVLIFTL